ncbi:TraM recognition domain-containing protein [Aquimarina sp. 2201CG14-23]|uniref:TraM recognition domain-containing protein n=1 Tax=Aquimarina mycalae TaxID=3040073 RepID=UPI002477DC77|nr:TraM recognition domain-containing protein [Aquimarina sp. 2201CG14-23]MDH7445853.1 TraM recognition domain-containing protein [Aquimarina sp. 2201CG14-23]
MKDSKFSIDLLVVVAFLMCTSLIISDIYISYYNQLSKDGFTNTTFTKGLVNIANKLPLIKNSFLVRVISISVFMFSSFGFKVKKRPEEGNRSIMYIVIAVLSFLIFVSSSLIKVNVYAYISITVVFFILFIWSFMNIRRHFEFFGHKDEFNEKNQNFKQEKGVKENPYSVNFKTDKGTINVVNPFRATMVLGTPGSGKSYSVIEEYIRQHIKKKFTMLVYDFKYPSLAKETYAFLEYYKKNYKIEPKFSVISLDDLAQSNFVNPLSPDLIRKAADAIEASQTVLYNLNKEWITKKDFFAQSAISYFASCIYFLKIYENGKYCTLPHAIALASCPDEKVFKIFVNYPELKFFMTPFADALEKEAFEQLSGQTASARIPLSQLATKELFWVMGNNVYPELNVPLAINSPEEPSILILANSPSTQTTNSPALGLISTQVLKEINKQNKQPCSVIIDELPTMYFMGLDNLIATARSNKISTTIGMQDLEQLKRDYGDKIAETIFNIVGNIFSGSVRSSTANKLQEIFGKKKQKLKNISVDTSSTSYSINESLEYVIPVATISQLSQGEFVGVVSDNFGEEIGRKIFRGKIKVDQRNDQIKKPIPDTIDAENLDDLVNGNFNRIVQEIDILIANELYEIHNKENLEEEFDNTVSELEETESTGNQNA